MLLLNINVSVLNYVFLMFIFLRSVREGKKQGLGLGLGFIQEEETEE